MPLPAKQFNDNDRKKDSLGGVPFQRISRRTQVAGNGTTTPAAAVTDLTLETDWKTIDFKLLNSPFDDLTFLGSDDKTRSYWDFTNNKFKANTANTDKPCYLFDLDGYITKPAEIDIDIWLRFYVPSATPFSFPLPDSMKSIKIDSIARGITEDTVRYLKVIRATDVIMQNGFNIQMKVVATKTVVSITGTLISNLIGTVNAIIDPLSTTAKPVLKDTTLAIYSLQ